MKITQPELMGQMIQVIVIQREVIIINKLIHLLVQVAKLQKELTTIPVVVVELMSLNLPIVIVRVVMKIKIKLTNCKTQQTNIINLKKTWDFLFFLILLTGLPIVNNCK